MNPEVDSYITRSEKWPDEMAELRPILLECRLTENIKWGKPCYGHEGRNVVVLQEMKSFPSLTFFKGALMSDPEGVLEEQGPNSRSTRRPWLHRWQGSAPAPESLTPISTWSMMDHIRSFGGNMADRDPEPCRVWTVAQAKARLSEVLRLAEEEGPQHIGMRRSFVVVPAGVWHANAPTRRPMGQWLVDVSG